jgi:hypothetical protein
MNRDGIAAQLVGAGLVPAALGTAITSIQVDPVPLAPGLARRFVASHLDHVSVPQRDAAVLLISELVTAIILNASTTMEVGVGKVESDVVLAVRDRSLPTADPPPGLHGRGKALVMALADDHGTLKDERFNTVWVVLREHGRAVGALDQSRGLA